MLDGRGKNCEIILETNPREIDSTNLIIDIVEI